MVSARCLASSTPLLIQVLLFFLLFSICKHQRQVLVYFFSICKHQIQVLVYLFSICKHQNTGSIVFLLFSVCKHQMQVLLYLFSISKHQNTGLIVVYLYVNTKVSTWALVLGPMSYALLDSCSCISTNLVPRFYCVYFSSLWTLVVLVHFRHNASSPLVLSPSIFRYINLQSQRSYFYF